MSRVHQPRPVARVRTGADAGVVRRPDEVIGEEPLEVRLGGQPWTTTMRTPGHDIELVHGFLHSEGIIATAADVRTARYCAGSVVDDATGTKTNTYNVIEVALAPQVAAPDPDRVRSGFTNSSCGVCGVASIDAVRRQGHHDPAATTVALHPDVVTALPERLRAEQAAFDRTGAVHAAGLFDAAGQMVVVREDVGRHNAVDKVIGRALLDDRLPAADLGLVVSSRASFEIVQKAALAGIGFVVAVSGPATLAVDTATELGMTLVGFVRHDGANVYAGGQRLGLGG